jgi:hypothetical protein
MKNAEDFSGFPIVAYPWRRVEDCSHVSQDYLLRTKGAFGAQRWLEQKFGCSPGIEGGNGKFMNIIEQI